MTRRSICHLCVSFAFSLTLAACTAGEVSSRSGEGNGTEGPDAGAGDPGGGGDGDQPMYDAGTVATGDCDQPVTSGLASGKHHAGEDCLNCHDGGGSAPHWTAAGTIYTAPTGGSALPGATLHLTDAAGKEIILVSAQNGNFWTSESISFPLHARASSCPDDRLMGGAIPDGGCNQSGCHDSDMRIALP